MANQKGKSNNPRTPINVPEVKNEKSGLTPIKPRNYFLLYILIIIGSVFILYSQGIKFEYTSCDDTDLIVDNYPFIKHTKNIPRTFKQSAFEIPNHLTEDKAYYRPMLITSFILDAQVQRPSSEGFPKPQWFHFMNILLHLSVCLILFLLLNKWTNNIHLSFILSILFAVHPLHTMAVSWIPGRNDTLMGLFTLLALFNIYKFTDSNKLKYLIYYIVFFILNLFTKESAVMLFPLSLFFIYVFKNESFVKLVKNPIYYIGSVFGLVLWYLGREKAMEGDISIPTMKENIAFFIENLKYIPMHFGKYFFPFQLSVMPGPTVTNTILGVISMLLIGWLLFKTTPKSAGLFALFWMGMFLAPTLIVPKLPAYEHRNYLPLIGLILALSKSDYLREFKLKTNLSYGLIGLSCFFFIRSFLHLDTYKNRFNFWENATEEGPFKGTAFVNLGKLQEESGNNVGAKDYYGKALEFDSATVKANNNYGAMVYVVDHDNEKALQFFKKEVKYYPTNTDALNNIGVYYQAKGDLDSAIKYFNKCIVINRKYYAVYERLFNLYMQTHQVEKALNTKTIMDNIIKENDLKMQ